jgi:hypothetical protein
MFFYDKERQSLVIPAKQNDSTNLYIATKNYRDRVSQTASIDFGKYINSGW